MGRYDKYFREEPNAKANAQPIKKEPKAKPVTTSRATKVAAPKIKRKNYRKSALRWNGILIFINVILITKDNKEMISWHSTVYTSIML